MRKASADRFWSSGAFEVILFISLVATSAFASEPATRQDPSSIRGIGIQAQIGVEIPKSTPFVDQDGKAVSLEDYFRKNKPVLLAIHYVGCPRLCHLQLEGMVKALQKVDWTVGEDFDVVALSMDHTETPELVKKARNQCAEIYKRPTGTKGWHFLVGEEKNIRTLTDNIGFGFRWDKEESAYNHSAGLFLFTPEGKMSRFLSGVEFEPATVRLAVLEAAKGRIGSAWDGVLLYCFHFDENAGKYVVTAWNVMIAGCLIVLGILVVFLGGFWYWEWKRKKNLVLAEAHP